MTLFAFTAASAAANYWHGRVTGGQQAALYLGGMSVAVAVVFALTLRQIRHEDRRRAGTVTGRLPRFSAAHWARYPGLTWRAWSLAVRDGHTSPRAALDAALGAHPADALQPVPVAVLRAASGANGRAYPGTASRSARNAARNRSRKRSRAAVPDADAEVHFAADLAAGEVPSLRRIQRELHVGQAHARQILERLTAAANRPPRQGVQLPEGEPG